MDNQQPGQSIQPNSQNNENFNSVEQTPNPEVAEIDAAVMQDNSNTAGQPQQTEPAANVVNQQPQQSAEPQANYGQATLTQDNETGFTDSQTNQSSDSDIASPQPVDGLVSQIGLKRGAEDEAIDTELSAPLLSWQASEPVQVNAQNKSIMPGVLGAVGLVALAIFLIGGINFGSVLSVITIIFGVFTLIYVNRQQQQLQNYTIFEEGVAVGNQFYGYSDLKSFNVVSDGDNSPVIELEPVKRFMVRTVIHPDGSNAEQVIDVLSQYLPRQDKEPSTIDRFSAGLRG